MSNDPSAARPGKPRRARGRGRAGERGGVQNYHSKFRWVLACGIARPDAAKFLAQIKGELETNEELQALFPDILYEAPYKDSPLWSVEKGIVVKRQSNPREATVEAHGVVEI